MEIITMVLAGAALGLAITAQVRAAVLKAKVGRLENFLYNNVAQMLARDSRTLEDMQKDLRDILWTEHRTVTEPEQLLRWEDR